jgi:hypothetical protein
MIFDWKFMSIAKDQNDIALYKQGAFGIQLNRYKEMLLKDYGVTEVVQKKAIPIIMDIKFSKTKTSSLSGLAIGSVNPAEITEPYLIPVTDDEMSTGFEEIDDILKRMRALLAQVGKQGVSDEEEKEIKYNKLNALRQAVRIIQGTNNLYPLIRVVNSMVNDGKRIFNDYEAIFKDRPAKSSDSNDAELSDFANEMSMFIKTSELFQNIGADLGHLLYTKEMEEDAETEEEKAILAESKKVVDEMTDSAKDLYLLRKKVIDAHKEFADRHIGQRNNTTNLLNAEKVVAGLSSLFRGVSELPLRSLQLLYKITRSAQGKAAQDSLDQVTELMEIRQRLMKRGNVLDLVNKIYQKDDKGKFVNKIIRKFDKEFYNEVDTRALQGGDKEWLYENIDIEAYKKEAEEVMTSRINRIMSEYGYDENLALADQDMSEDEYEDMKAAIIKEEQRFDIKRLDFDGFDNYILKRHPSEKWLSKEYKAIESDKDLTDLYNFVQKINKKAKETGYIDNTTASTFLPFLRKSMAEEFAFTNPLSAVKNFQDHIGDSLKMRKGDVGFGQINEVTGELENSIPKYYTFDFTRQEDGTNDYSEVSQDIFKNMILYLQQVNKYKYLSDVEGQINLIKSVEQFKDQHLRTNHQNEVLLDENNEPIVEKGNDQNVKMFDDFMRVLLYDQKYILSDTDVPLHVDKVLGFIKRAVNASIKPFNGGKDVWKTNENPTPTSLMKTIDAANRFFQLKTLGFELTSGAVNMFGGNVQLLAQAGNYFDAREVFRNEAAMIGQDFVKMLNRKDPKSKDVFIELMNTFMPMKDDPAYDELQKAGISRLTRGNMSDALMYFMRKPEQWLEKSIFTTLLQNSIIENGRIVNVREYVKQQYKDRYDNPEAFQNSKKMKQDIEELKRTRSMAKIAKIVDGKLEIEGLDLNDRDELQRLTNLSRRIARNATGGLSDGDINRMSMSIWTKSMMVFKNWIPKLADTRFSEFRKVSDDFSVIIDEDGVAHGEKFDVGRIRLFGRVLVDSVSKFQNNFINLMAMNEKGIEYVDKLYTDFAIEYKKQNGEDLNMTREDFIDLIRNNTRKQLQELLILASLFALTLSMGAFEPDDDEDKAAKNLRNFTLRVTDKFVNELSFFYNPKELQNLLSGGMFPAIGVVTDFGKIIKHFFQEITGEDFNADTDSAKAKKKAQPIKHLMKFFPASKAAVNYAAIFSDTFAEEFDVTIPKEASLGR